MMRLARRRLMLAAAGALVVPAQAVAVCRPTPRDALGPFYKPGAPAVAELCAAAGKSAQRLTVTGRVTGLSDCRPLADARIEVWQADAQGDYTMVGGTRDDPRCLLRASLTSDREGRYQYSTLLPGEYPGRPRHIHYRVTHANYAELVTQLYFDSGRGIAPPLMATLKRDGDNWLAVFDITLSRR
jgi:protocatechuate 3,4-dioxygenase beta subunit